MVMLILRKTDNLQVSESSTKGSCQCSEEVSYPEVHQLLRLTLCRMLYDFHHQQNSRKPGSVHGIYLVSGMKTVKPAVAVSGGHIQDGEDSFMQSSPFMSSSMPQAENTPSTKVVTLVREEQLEGLVLASRGIEYNGRQETDTVRQWRKIVMRVSLRSTSTA